MDKQTENKKGFREFEAEKLTLDELWTGLLETRIIWDSMMKEMRNGTKENEEKQNDKFWMRNHGKTKEGEGSGRDNKDR